jgi:hypothetical protein
MVKEEAYDSLQPLYRFQVRVITMTMSPIPKPTLIVFGKLVGGDGWGGMRLPATWKTPACMKRYAAVSDQKFEIPSVR